MRNSNITKIPPKISNTCPYKIFLQTYHYYSPIKTKKLLKKIKPLIGSIPNTYSFYILENSNTTGPKTKLTRTLITPITADLLVVITRLEILFPQ